MLSIEQVYRHDEWWDEFNFSQLERDVRRLQGRIYRASKKGDKKGERNLMKLMVRSETAKCNSTLPNPPVYIRERIRIYIDKVSNKELSTIKREKY